MKALNLVTRHWPLFALLVSAAMLATAHIFQAIGYAPCALCLRQREVYWVAIAVAAAALVAARMPATGRLARVFDAGLAAIFLFGAGLAFYHSGVEWKWWPGPESCVTVGGTVSAADIEALLSGADIRVPACDEPDWWFLGLTMANWNTLASLGLAALGTLAAVRRGRP